MYVDDLWLTCRLLLDENDIVVVIVLGLGLGHVRHSGRCRDHLRLLLLLRWIVCGRRGVDHTVVSGLGN